MKVISPDDLGRSMNARKRRAAARQELISITLQLQELTEPEPDDADDEEAMFSYRAFLEQRRDELKVVIAQAKQDERLL